MFDINLYDNYDLQLCEDFSIDIEAGEILTEFVTVGRFKKENMSVAVNPDANRNKINTEYFRVYNNEFPDKATKIARIKFRSCEYVIHNNNGRKTIWFPDRDEIRNIVRILNCPSAKDKGFTVWQSLILSFNFENGLDFEDTKNNTSDNLIYKNYLPIDLKIPDYETFLSDIK